MNYMPKFASSLALYFVLLYLCIRCRVMSCRVESCLARRRSPDLVCEFGLLSIERRASIVVIVRCGLAGRKKGALCYPQQQQRQRQQRQQQLH